MKSLVVFESFFGNTEKIARAIGIALGETGEVQVVRVEDIKPGDWQSADMLVVGSPTRGFNVSPATKTFLKALPAGCLQGKKVAAFDTRLSAAGMKKVPGFVRFMIGIFGYAAEKIGKALQAKGAVLVAAAEGFWVEDSEGPLTDGELDRAADWAKKLA